MVKLIHSNHSLKEMKKLTTIHTPKWALPYSIWQNNLGGKVWSRMMLKSGITFLKFGINPNVSDFMFAKKRKHAIIAILSWIAHNLHWAITFTTNKPCITRCNLLCTLGPVSLRLMTSQFKDIVTHTQKYKTVKCTFCGVWVHKFVWNFKGALWNFTQNF